MPKYRAVLIVPFIFVNLKQSTNDIDDELMKLELFLQWVCAEERKYPNKGL